MTTLSERLRALALLKHNTPDLQRLADELTGKVLVEPKIKYTSQFWAEIEDSSGYHVACGGTYEEAVANLQRKVDSE